MQKRIIDNEIGDLREREGNRVHTEKAAKAKARTTPNAKAVRKKPKRASAREGAPPEEANATEEAPRQEAEAKEDALREEDDAKEEAKSKAKAKPTRKAKAKAKAKSKAETLDTWIKKDTNKHEDTATAAASTAACLQQLQQMQQQKQQQRNLCFQGAEEETQRAKRPAPLLCEPPAKKTKSCRLASWPEIVAHDRRLFLFDVSPSARQRYEHTPIVHFAAQGKIFLFGKSEVGKAQACSDIGDLQELTAQGPSGGNTPWMEHFYEVPYDTMKTHLAMEQKHLRDPPPAANPGDNYTNTFWVFAPGSPTLPAAVTDLSSVDAIGWLQDRPNRAPVLTHSFIFTDGTQGRLGRVAYAMCDGLPAEEVFPVCSSNDTLVAALCLVNHRLMKFMVAVACENKIEEIKTTRQKLIKNLNEKEILDALAKWKTSHDPKRWGQHAVNFPKFRAAVNFAHECITFDESSAVSRLNDLRKTYKEDEDESEEDEEEGQDAVKDDDDDDDVDEDAD